jgi:PTS system cellobiose-specific IIB component
MNILLICTTGVSTGMLVKNMQMAAEKRKVAVQINAVPEVQLKENTERADVILLGPQVRYLRDKIKSIVPGKPVQVIDAKDYGMMDGESVLNMALNILRGE